MIMISVSEFSCVVATASSAQLLVIFFFLFCPVLLSLSILSSAIYPRIAVG